MLAISCSPCTRKWRVLSNTTDQRVLPEFLYEFYQISAILTVVGGGGIQIDSWRKSVKKPYNAIKAVYIFSQLMNIRILEHLTFVIFVGLGYWLL